MGTLAQLQAAQVALLQAIATQAPRVSYQIGDQSITVNLAGMASALGSITQSMTFALQGPQERVTEAYSG